jgi:threonylcarbamoyladenosine tRNA methylthiotransferase MtaB
MAGRSRAFVKIQDGCQHRCAFCIVPTARGRSRSQEPKVVIDQVRGLVESGHLDVTLTGVDIGHYGWDLYPRTSLAALVRSLAEVDGLGWLRLSSVLPAYFTPDLLDAVSTLPVVAPHLHLPLQSGSDRVLRLMRRPYHTGMYRDLVSRLAAAIPALGLGADVIVGHPGETEEDFEATLGFVTSLPVSYLHVFPYSDRRGTEAAGRPDHVPAAAIRERARRLRRLGREKNLAFRRALAGSRRPALVLDARDPSSGWRVGLTSNYVEVLFEAPEGFGRGLVTLEIGQTRGDHTYGRLIGEASA